MSKRTKRRRPKNVRLRIAKPYPPGGCGKHLDWERAPAFNVNPRGILIHRVKDGRTHLMPWGNHNSITQWCGNGVSGEGVSLTDDPPKDRLLCAYCEAKAVAAGEPTADQLAGRHVHIGALKAIRTCCRGCDRN